MGQHWLCRAQRASLQLQLRVDSVPGDVERQLRARASRLVAWWSKLKFADPKVRFLVTDADQFWAP